MFDRTHSGIRIASGNHPSLLRRIRMAFTLHKERRDLARLDPHLLKDVGLSEDERRREIRRSVWDAPRHWHE